MAVQNVACENCGTMVTFSYNSDKEVKDTGMGEDGRPKTAIEAGKGSTNKFEECPNCGETVWMYVVSNSWL
jgi:ribosomal protein S27AE